MPAEEYSPLQQLLLEPGLTSVKTLAEICHADRAPLATALLRVFRSEGRETELLIELNSAEVRIIINYKVPLFNFAFFARLLEKRKPQLCFELHLWRQLLWISI